MKIDNALFERVIENLQVTVSIGATLVRDEDTVETLIKRADTLMYESKKTGRNRLALG